MYVWKEKSRRDRRHFAATGLDTLDEADLETLRKNEITVRKEEEVHRYELEVSKFPRTRITLRDKVPTPFFLIELLPAANRSRQVREIRHGGHHVLF